MKKKSIINLLLKNKIFRSKEEKDYISNSLFNIKYFNNEYDKIYHNLTFHVSRKEFFEQLSDLMRIKYYNLGEKIYKYNNESKNIYILLKGSIDIYVRNNNTSISNLNILYSSYNKKINLNLKIIKNNKYLNLLYNHYKDNNLEEFYLIYNIFIYTNKLNSKDLLILYKEILNDYFDKNGNFLFFYYKNIVKNKIFGEFNIHLKNNFRKELSICLEDCIVCYFEKDQLKLLFNSILKKGLKFYFQKYIKKLKEKDINNILNEIEFIEFKKDDILYKEDAFIENIYMIYKGEIELFKYTENNDNGYYIEKKKELHKVIKDFEFFGFGDCFENRFSQYEIIVKSYKTFLIKWDYLRFKKLIEEIKPLKLIINHKVLSLKKNFKKKLLQNILIDFKKQKKTSKKKINYRKTNNEILILKKKTNMIKIKKTSIDLNLKTKSLKFKKKKFYSYMNLNKIKNSSIKTVLFKRNLFKIN